MRPARLASLLLALVPAVLAPSRLAHAQTLAMAAPSAGFVSGAVAPSPEGAESERLAQLRLAERDVDAVESLAEASSRQGVTLPESLDGNLATQLLLPPLGVRLRPRLLRQLALYRSEARARRAMQSWLRHAGRFRAQIESTLLAEGLPVELVWVVAAESGFDPASTSGVGAAGLWQLMPEAARTYGLRVDAWVDERRDPQRSTRAAARYLRDLFARFGSWELALAAYNMGYNGLLRAVRRFNTTDFDTLATLEAGLPYETVHYVPRILAAAVAARNTALLGLDGERIEPAQGSDDVPLQRSLTLAELAGAAGVPVDALRALNPSVQGARTPPVEQGSEPFTLHVPVGRGAALFAALETVPRTPERWYRLRYGETVEEVALRLGVEAGALVACSGFSSARTLTGGTLLRTPDREPSAVVTPERPVVVVQSPASQPTAPRWFYRVGPGDDANSVAHALGVDRERLAQWNALDEHSRWQSGLWLQLYAEREPAGVRLWRESEVLVLERGSEAFYERSVAHDGRVRLHVEVSEGDTLASLAEHFGLSTGSLARINRRARGAALTVGERLVVYVSRERLQELQREGARRADTEASNSPASPAVVTP